MRVKESMTTDVLTVRSTTPLKEAAALLAEHRISGLPVVDAEGHVVGVLSEGDILFKESGAQRQAEPVRPAARRAADRARPRSSPRRRSARRCRRRR